ncbi:hypothetical protein ACLKA6_003196 [Drosophila palustris]
MASTSSCNSYTAPDNDEMLTCSKCSSQYHFQCSGSDSCVSTSAWHCTTCIKVQHNLRSETSSAEGKHTLNTEPASLGTDNGTNATVMQHNKQKDLGDEALPGKQQLLLQQLEEEYCVLKRNSCVANTHALAIRRVDAAHRRRRAPKTRDCLIALVSYQGIVKGLPIFNGDPKEWPLFLSSYEKSTRIAGYSNEENLIRRQKCLKGTALEAVRDSFMFPDMLPDVIPTLKMYFGRPELKVRVLIGNVRNLPSPKGKLESLIEFAVKNMCATMKATKLDAHLNNPTLLQELIEKMGSDMMLNWAIHVKEYK